MHIADFHQAEQSALAAIRAARCLQIENGQNEGLSTAAGILAEVRHFAACWSDNQENVDMGAISGVVGDRIKAQLIERLVTFCKPTA